MILGIEAPASFGAILLLDASLEPNKPGRLAHSSSQRALRTMAMATAAMLAFAGPSYAGWIDDITHPIGTGIVNGTKAVGDVVTLGELGRQHDREAAEAAQREAQAKAEAAQQQRTDRINSTNAQIATLTQIVANLGENEKVADAAWALHDKIVTVGQAEITARARSGADAERAADATRKSREELAGLNSALTSLNSLDHKLQGAVSTQQNLAPDSAQTLDAARQLLRTADLDAASNGLYLDRAVRSLKTGNLKQVIAASIEARSLLVGLRSTLAEQLRGYSDQLVGKQKELASL